MYPLQPELLHCVGQERCNPVDNVFPNAIVVEFVKEQTVRHIVERLAEIKQTDVYWVTISRLAGNHVDSDYKLGFAGASASKSVLTIARNRVLVDVPQNCGQYAPVA